MPVLSVIIPVFNRGNLIRHTLESVRRASFGLDVETIVVDDGSDIPVEEEIRDFPIPGGKILRQENQGLLFARLRGLEASSGKYCVFLDSDDLFGPDKLSAQLAAMEHAEVSYTDTARCVIDPLSGPGPLSIDETSRITTNVAEFYLDVQPAPHSPMFRTEYLREITLRPLFPPRALYNPVAEIWFYYNAAPQPARVAYCPGPHTIIGSHGTERLTDRWEKLAVASLGVMEAFAETCPPGAVEARRLAGRVAFRAWRRLPYDFSAAFQKRLLDLWKRQAEGTFDGGGLFRKAARLLGPINAARSFRRWKGAPYDSCRTMDAESFAILFEALPGIKP